MILNWSCLLITAVVVVVTAVAVVFVAVALADAAAAAAVGFVSSVLQVLLSAA